jgi:inosine-uridine nucleoside N-ribohydrolase
MEVPQATVTIAQFSNLLKDDAGNPRYSYTLPPVEQLPEAASYLWKRLAAEPDGSIVFVQVGLSTNLARLLETQGDEISPLNGKELVAKKVRLLSIMAGAFGGPSALYTVPSDYAECNVVSDIPSAKKVIADWPTEIVFSGFEIGEHIQYPPKSMQDDFNYVKYHPIKDGYRFFKDGLDKSTATFDLTSVLYAVRPDRGYFDLSSRGTVTVRDNGAVSFEPSKNGKHRFLIASPVQIAMVREALVQLTSEPPQK